MRTRKIALTIAGIALLAGCGNAAQGADQADTAAKAETVAATETPKLSSYLDTNDVTSHMACTAWNATTDDDSLTGTEGATIAGRASNSNDPDMAALATEAANGPMVTDPWTMTKLCVSHGYTAETGSFAEHYSS